MNSPGSQLHDETGKSTLEVIARATAFNKWMYEEIRPCLTGRVLEIGSGIGNISGFLVQDDFPVTLSDYNPEYKKILKEKFSASGNVQDVLQIDLEDKNFESTYHDLRESFDTIFLLNVIEHLENDSRAIGYCRYLLKEGGNLVLLAPAYDFLFCRFDKELGHYRRYTVSKMCLTLLSCNFEITRKKYFNFLGIFGWFFMGKLFNRKKIGGSEMKTFNFLVPLARIADRLTGHRAGLSVIVCAKKSPA